MNHARINVSMDKELLGQIDRRCKNLKMQRSEYFKYLSMLEMGKIKHFTKMPTYQPRGFAHAMKTAAESDDIMKRVQDLEEIVKELKERRSG